MIMKQVFKNREKSLRSEEFEAGAYEDDASRILPKSKRKSLVNNAQGLGLINFQTWNPKKRRIMKLNCIIFPLRSLAKLYNSENVTVTLLLPWNSRKDRLASCVQSGLHHFIGWRYIPLTYIPGEGVTCLQIFEWRKLTIVFHKNTFALPELIGYVESTDSNEIWPEHSLSIEEQNCVRD